jgi:hypothetical protein
MLIPHEHGAYGQLGFPVAAVMATGRPSVASALLVIACAAAFVAYEPLLVLLGQRGVRARREWAAEAKRTLAGSAGVAVLAGIAGAWLLRPELRWTLGVPAICGAAAVALVLARVHKTTPGELLVAVALSSCAWPVGVAAGLHPAPAAACAAVFAAGFCSATLAVRSTIALQRREPASVSRAAAIIVAIASPVAVGILARLSGLDARLWIAAAPLSLLALVLAARPPSARHLRRVGWALIAASAGAAVILALLLRGGGASA